MADALSVLHTVITVVGIIVLIMVARLNPAIALVIGAIYLGLATGLGLSDTGALVAQGFGDVLADVGLVIAFGVLLGTLLSAMGAIEKITESTLRLFGQRGWPYAFSISGVSVFPTIFYDTALVLLAPLARSLALRSGSTIGKAGGTMTIGLVLGLGLVPPGAAAIIAAGQLEVPIGNMILGGLLVGIPTAVIGQIIYLWLINRGLWNAEKDEAEFGSYQQATATEAEQESKEFPSLPVSLTPPLIALFLIVLGTVSDVAGFESALITFLGNPTIALLLGLLAAYLLAVRTLSYGEVENAFDEGLRISGIVLVFTGTGGSLAAVLGETGVGDVIANLFSADMFSPILLAWFLTAILRAALGSSITALLVSTSILAPLLDNPGVSPLMLALAAGSGSIFLFIVNDTTFWIYSKSVGVSVQGAFKSYTLPIAIVSVISLIFILALNLVL